MILKLINNENTYEFNVTDLNEGVKLYYHFEIPTVDIPDGKYNMQLLDGETVIYEDIVCIGDFKGATIQYKRGENIYINAPLDGKFEDVTVEITATQTTVYPNDGFDAMTSVVIDATPVYDDGFNSGSVDGYRKGYDNGNIIGYNSGYTDGETAGYNSGLEIGKEIGVNQAGEIIAETARVLDITENGTYVSHYSDPISPDITGVYPDGENFYNYAILKNISYDTGILSDNDTKIELWWCGDVTQYDNAIFGWQGSNGNFKVCVVNNTTGTYSLNGEINYKSVKRQNLESNVWYHIELSKQEGFKINGELIGTFESVGDVKSSPIYLNTLNGSNFANGKYGMIKINDTIIIPTPDGFLNTNTNEMLSVAYAAGGGNYAFTKEQPIIPEGNLIKTVNVNVIAKAKLQNGLKLGESSFDTVPDYLDFSQVTDWSHMFYECGNLKTIPLFDMSKVKDLSYTFRGCLALITIPQIDTSNLESLYYTFYHCDNLTTIPQIDTSKVSNMQYTFAYCKKLQSLPAFDMSSANQFTFSGTFRNGGGDSLTDFGGFQNLKISITDGYSLAACSKLSYQSCINVLNGLYDFTGNSETPTSVQGQLKVHPNFLTTVGNEISIGTSKGWTITA